MPNKETWKQVKEYVAIALTLGALGSQLKAEAAPRLEEPREHKIFLPLFVNPEIPDLLEGLHFGREFRISDGPGIEKRAIDFALNENGKDEAGVAWQQLDPEKQPEGWTKLISRVYFEPVLLGGGLAGGEKRLLMEWEEPADAVEAGWSKPSLVYHNPHRVPLESLAFGSEKSPGKVVGLSETTVLIGANGESGNPDLIYNNGYWVAFWGNGNEEGFPRIYLQIISDESERRKNEALIQVGENPVAWRQFYSSLAKDQGGNVAIVWEQDTEQDPGNFHIWGERRNRQGEIISEARPLVETPYAQHPKLVRVGERDLLTWLYPYVGRDRAFHVDIWGLCLGPGLEKEGDPFLVSQSDEDKGVHDLAVNSAGEVLVVWPVGGEIEGRLILSDGSMLKTEKLASQEGQLLNHPKVASFEDGPEAGFLVTYHQAPPWKYATESRVWVKGVKRVVSPPFFGSVPYLTLGKAIPVFPDLDYNQWFANVETSDQVLIAAEIDGYQSESDIFGVVGQVRR